MSKLLSAIGDTVNSGLKFAGSALEVASGSALIKDVGSAVSKATGGKAKAKSNVVVAEAAKTAEAKGKIFEATSSDENRKVLRPARSSSKFEKDVEYLKKNDDEINNTLFRISSELDEDNVAAQDAERAAGHVANLLANQLQKMGATDLASDIRKLQAGGVTASEFNQIVGNSLRHALALTATSLSDVASAHGKISAMKDAVAAMGNTVQKLKDTSFINLARLNSLLIGRGLMPSDKMMEDINNGAIFFGENGLRRLDVVTFIMSLVSLKSVRLYAQEDSNSSAFQLFSKGEELRMITGFRLVEAGSPILPNDTFILGKDGALAQGDVSAIREVSKVYDANYLIATTTLPTLAPNVGTLAKIAASGFISGSMDNVFGQFVGLFTESISNFISGQRDSDFHRGM